MKNFYLPFMIIFPLINFAPPAGARDFATHGHSFEILEPDLLKQIEHKLKALNEDGTLAEHKMRKNEFNLKIEDIINETSWLFQAAEQPFS